MKYLSVCSGIEAATVAWHPLGWEPVAFSEIEPFPSAVLGAHWPHIQNLGDMTKFEQWDHGLLAEVDIVVGGPPCQAFSVAGLRRSLSDARGNVTLAYVRMLDHIDTIRRANGRPPVIAVYENVPGMLSTRDNAFGCFVGALCGCDEAPETQTGKWPKAGLLSGEARRVGYRILDAQYFGVAQRRRRIFLVAVPCELVDRLGERACPSEILALSESVSGNPSPSRKTWEGVARTTAGSLTSSGRGVERPGESRGQDDVVIRCPSVARTLTRRMHKGFDGSCDSQTPVVFTKAKRAPSDQDDESLVPGEVAPTQNQFDIGDTRATTVVAYDITGVPATTGARMTDVHTSLRARPPGTSENSTTTVAAYPIIADASRRNSSAIKPSPDASGLVRLRDPGLGVGDDGSPMFTLQASSPHSVSVPNAVRRLTPRECERLQGFPDDHTAIEYRGKPAADGPRYKALGNSMAVPCMWWIGHRIKQATQGAYS